MGEKTKQRLLGHAPRSEDEAKAIARDMSIQCMALGQVARVGTMGVPMVFGAVVAYKHNQTIGAWLFIGWNAVFLPGYISNDIYNFAVAKKLKVV